eukprot:CAMPEP_0170213468 /NCGR_PEP_ID=MMETSP0116_2-20130129/6358_1 /TAXON_ID=400756 /ORGANISM="Durinskia baltica, Strain CSIRO CS-38" /LENGTH=1130 /DNA_ID=CAMNT_0010464019 /DNA_START=103 /DNA_END=3495 /DNA_ORIENTATION=-
MEVTVLDTGDLPSGTIISFHTGSVRRHTKLEKDRPISLASYSGSEPVRVDLMHQIGMSTFDIVSGQEVYEVPIREGDAETEVKLKVQIKPSGEAANGNAAADGVAFKEDDAEGVNGSTVRKLQTALMMRSYLDDHDVLRQMQELLQEMVTHRPEDPIQYLIQRLDQVCRDGQGVDLADLEEDQVAKSKRGGNPDQAVGSASENDSNDENPPGKQRPSVSEEAHGAFDKRQAYERKVIAKDDGQKSRLREVLLQCWMFKSHTPENFGAIIDAMSEKKVEKGVTLINRGEEGRTMWVIETGALECFKPIEGKEKLVKTCRRGDVFGELALLYNCPRAATVVSSEACVLWELDRETFKAICYEAAQAAPLPEYEGFIAPDPKKQNAKAHASEDNADNESEAEAEIMKRSRPGKRREGVSAEAMKEDTAWEPTVYPKTAEERTQLSNIIRTSHDSKLHMLFGIVPKATFAQIIDAMQLMQVESGQDVIQQGDVGDFFYIVKKGTFDIFVQKGDEPRKKVFQAAEGFAFGELALLYNAPRSATVTASVPAEVWALDRTAFRNLVVRSSEERFKKNVEFLNGVEIFQVLDENERAALAEVLEEEEFEDDEAIVEQGGKDEQMFIILEGKAVACIKGEQGEVEVMSYEVGNYFGEIALLSGEPRKASVYAVGPCVCLYISRATFMRVLGSLSNLLERNISRYEKYADAIANTQTAGMDDLELSETLQSEATEGKKGMKRKRERKTELNLTLKPVAGKFEKSDGEPATLADKVAQDFKNPAIVSPAESLAVADSAFALFGGLALGQKFTMDKLLHAHMPTGAGAEAKGEDTVYSWNAPSKLKQGTEIGVVCQKGQKSADDPTPNQDNFFVHQGKDGVSMYGVCDGHGPFGHLVSFRLVQALPLMITKSQHYGKDWEECLKEAFLEAQRDLVEFCAGHSINIEASGAAGSVVVMEEQTVHIAFIGDARVMLGSWNRRDSRMIFCSKDHKPEIPEERARLEAAGSEVREIDPGSYRIYLPGSSFPGLTMSRAFGDTACGGVLREPEYHKFALQPTDQWYVIVASDGIWEFMEGEEVCSLTAKKLRLKGPRETINFLVNASRKRWKYCCGDYCDDITGVLVQWNADNKESKTNFALTVPRA